MSGGQDSSGDDSCNRVRGIVKAIYEVKGQRYQNDDYGQDQRGIHA